MKKTSLLLTTLAFLLAASPSPLRAAEEPLKATHGALDAKDRKFVTEAAQGGMVEVEVGKLASEKGMTPDIKKLGVMLMTDHAKANAELKKLAEERGVTLPTELDPKHTAVHHKLASADPAKFDEEFLKAMESDHKEDIAMFETASKELTDPELRAFAAKQLPTLQMHKEHLEMAGAKK